MVKKPTDYRRGESGSSSHDITGGTKDLSGADAPRRIDRLAEVVDRCTEAQKIAEALNEKLLSYLLAMAIQEARAAMRVEVAAAANVVETASPPSRARRRPGAG